MCFYENIGHVHVEDGGNNASHTDKSISRDTDAMQVCLYWNDGILGILTIMQWGLKIQVE